MYNNHYRYQCPYYANSQMYSPKNIYQNNSGSPCPYLVNMSMYNPDPGYQPPYDYLSYAQQYNNEPLILEDYGPEPFVINIEEAAMQNTNFRLALWTGNHLQLTLMSIEVGGDIGLEIHPQIDQFLCVQEGEGMVLMGGQKDQLDFQSNIYKESAFIIPAGYWHNIMNTGNTPLKLYSIYAPPQHPFGTVHETKEDAQHSH